MEKRFGFTIIELMLAMTFLSILMITIAILVINITNIYTKGVTIKDVNATGRTLSDDFKRAISASPPVDVTNVSSYFVSDQNGGGRFCTGLYSYIWNDAEKLKSYLEDPGSAANGLVNNYDDAGKSLPPIRLVKVKDITRAYCGPEGGGREGDVKMEYSPIDLLAQNEADLALFDVQVFAPAANNTTGQRYYSISFVLGTLRGTMEESQYTNGELASNNTCVVPKDFSSEFNYCAINKFNVSMRATGSNE